MDIKKGIKDESCFLDFHSEQETEPFTKDVKKVKTETVTCGSDCHIDIKTENEEKAEVSNLHSLDQREFFSEDSVMQCSKSKIDTKIEIQEEQWWLVGSSIETAFIYNIKDEDFPPVTSSRSCTVAVSGSASGKSPLSATEISGVDTSFYNEEDHLECEHQKSGVRELSTVEKQVLSEQPGKCSEEGEMYIRPSFLKQKTLIHQGKRPHECKTCDKSFTRLSHLKLHNLIHEGKKPHKCHICDKSFTRLSYLKIHNLIHEGKKPHKCHTCDKSFTRLSYLKIHNLIHEGKKPHKCSTCDKSFTRLSSLKIHNLIHEGKKPHKCPTCDKSFTLLSYLKMHNLIHEGKKPHKCPTCDKSFIRLPYLKIHNLIHEGKKPHKCNTCDKSFTELSSLKRHSLIHRDNK